MNDAAFLNTIENVLRQADAALSPLGAGILAAASLKISNDSRSFAAKLDIAHALVIRECVTLSDEHGLICLDEVMDRSQRVFYQLSARGQKLMADAHV
ncbi:MAG: hypothetical protein AAF307_11565 [Pseudomonadota bacterium]